MPNLSIPVGNSDPRFTRFGWAIRLSPMLVAIILATLWLAGTPADVPDLRFTAPLVARPGTSIGLRAWQIARDDDGYPVVFAPEVEVELRNDAGLTVARTKLSASLVQGVEGSLTIPSGLDGEHSLIAHAEIDGRALEVDRALHVRPGIDSRRPAGREVNAFQTYELGSMRVVDSKRAPAVLDVRAAEGVCVPDLPCTLVVWVGDWEGRVRARSLAGFRFEADTVRASRGFARLPSTVRGQEGRVAVEAIGEDGAVLAAREARLPVLPGGLVARASVDAGSVRLEWEGLGGPRPVLVDIFQEHRWTGARSLGPGEGSLGRFPPGVWRLQVRTDLFSDNTAAVLFVVVTDPDGGDPLILAADSVLADADRDGLDPLAMAIVDGAFSGDQGDALAALFSVPNFDVVAMGPGVSTTIGVDEALAFAQERRRWWAAAAILLLGFSVSMVLLRVELIARAEARQLLEDLGEGAPPPRRPTFGRGLWAFVLLVFVLMAVLALSKRWF